MAKKIQKFDYELSYRVRSRVGIWGNWNKGFGQWIDLELVQRQIKMICQGNQGRSVEIKFQKDGKLLDYYGNESKKTILYEAR